MSWISPTLPIPTDFTNGMKGHLPILNLTLNTVFKHIITWYWFTANYRDLVDNFIHNDLKVSHHFAAKIMNF